MAVPKSIEVSAEELEKRRARLLEIFAMRDRMIESGELEEWDEDQINEYVRKMRGENLEDEELEPT